MALIEFTLRGIASSSGEGVPIAIIWFRIQLHNGSIRMRLRPNDILNITSFYAYLSGEYSRTC